MKLQKHLLVAVVAVALFCAPAAEAVTTLFFNSSQTTNLVATNATSDTISSAGYLFTFTRDKLFTGGVGLTNPIGRPVRIPWPNGLEAQAVTAGPALGGARITIKRQDGQPFDIAMFTAKLLASTAGAGAAIEVMPLLNGEDGFPDPLMCEASGYYGQNFTYNTPTLTGFDTYKITLYVDYALMSLTVVDASLPPPSPPGLQIFASLSNQIQLSWPTNSAGFTLQQNSNLATTNWMSVTNAVSVAGTNNQITISPLNGNGFFRLKKP